MQLVSLAKADESTADCLLRLVDAKATTKINFDEKGESFVLTVSDRWRTCCVEWGEITSCARPLPRRDGGRDGLAGGQFHKVSKKQPFCAVLPSRPGATPSSGSTASRRTSTRSLSTTTTAGPLSVGRCSSTVTLRVLCGVPWAPCRQICLPNG